MYWVFTWYYLIKHGLAWRLIASAPCLVPYNNTQTTISLVKIGYITIEFLLAFHMCKPYNLIMISYPLFNFCICHLKLLQGFLNNFDCLLGLEFFFSNNYKFLQNYKFQIIIRKTSSWPFPSIPFIDQLKKSPFILSFILIPRGQENQTTSTPMHYIKICICDSVRFLHLTHIRSIWAPFSS